MFVCKVHKSWTALNNTINIGWMMSEVIQLFGTICYKLDHSIFFHSSPSNIYIFLLAMF